MRGALAVAAPPAAGSQLALTPTAEPPLTLRSLTSPPCPQLMYIVVKTRIIQSH